MMRVEPRNFLQRLEQRVLPDSRLRQAPGRFAGVGFREGDEQVLGGDVLVPEVLGDLESAVEGPGQLPRGRRVRRGAGDLGLAVQILLHLRGRALPGRRRASGGSGTATPSLCRSRARRRWSGVSSALPRARASRWASWIASWDLIVSWSNLIVLPRLWQMDVKAPVWKRNLKS